MTPHTIAPLLIIPVMLFAVYRRVRRNIGAQKLRPRAMKFRIGLLGLALLLLLALATQNLRVAEAVIAGAVLGVALGLFNLRLTKFSTRVDGIYYTPNVFLGVALSVLLLSRLVYRAMVLRQDAMTGPVANSGLPPLNPLTLSMVGLLAGYYIAYYVGILRHPASTSNPAPPLVDNLPPP